MLLYRSELNLVNNIGNLLYMNVFYIFFFLFTFHGEKVLSKELLNFPLFQHWENTAEWGWCGLGYDNTFFCFRFGGAALSPHTAKKSSQVVTIIHENSRTTNPRYLCFFWQYLQPSKWHTITQYVIDTSSPRAPAVRKIALISTEWPAPSKDCRALDPISMLSESISKLFGAVTAYDSDLLVLLAILLPFNNLVAKGWPDFLTKDHVVWALGIYGIQERAKKSPEFKAFLSR